MKKMYFLSLLFYGLIINIPTFGQCNQDIVLNSQEDVDSFVMNYGCTEIDGSLTIEGEDIVDLSGLSGITSITDTLKIHNNDALTNINGLYNITSVENIWIYSNESLVNIDGLSNISSIGAFFRITLNNALTNIDGLNNLNSVGGSFDIISNPSLTNIDGLSSLNYIGGHLWIVENNVLTNLDGLSSLNYIGWHLWIGNEPLWGNNSLISINGLSSLNYIGGNLLINDNSTLNTCCIILYLAPITQGNVIIDNNASGCNSLEEINGFCSKFKITAQPFYDQNENSIFDNQEQILYNLPFTISPEALYSFSYDNGITKFFVEPNTYTLQYDTESNSLWQVNGQNSYLVEITDSIDTTLYFPMQPVTDFIIQNVDVTSSITRCNQQTNVWLTYTNKSSEPTSGYVHLIADELYESVEMGEKLYYRYGYVWWPTVEKQLQKGGLRLAKVLNDIFD